jgi:hypothetical protein
VAKMMMEAISHYKTNENIPETVIIEKLKEAEREAADPTIKRLSHEEVFGKFRKKYGYTV